MAGILNRSQAGKLERQWGESARSRQTLEGLRELREKLREEVLRWEGGGAVGSPTIQHLNRLMAKHPMLTRLNPGPGGTTAETYSEPNRPEDLFAPLAQSAAMLFANVDRKRVRKCGLCVLHFHDTSKKGTRRWCSMQLCGNRLKVAAYAARKRPRVRRQAAPTRGG
jgi:predicted RNA-binding Zn ribbon-like protein